MTAVAMLAGLFMFRERLKDFRWDLFLGAFAQLDPFWLVASVVLIMLTYVGRAFRWRVMMDGVTPRPRIWSLISATIIGFTAIVVFGRAGELVRPYLIAVKEKVSFSSQIAAWLLERIFDLLVVLLIFGFALTQIHIDTSQLGPGLQWVLRTGGHLVGLLATLCMVILIMLRHFSETMQRRLLDGISFLPKPTYRKVEEIVIAFTGGMQSTRRDGVVVQILLWTAVEWAVIVGCNLCLFKAFPSTAQFSMIDTVVFTGFVAFGSAVQIPGVGGGMQVAAVLVLTELFGLPLESSTGLAVLIWLLTYVLVVPVGILVGLHEGLTWNKFKEIEEKAAQ